jgi:hypothetical protein
MPADILKGAVDMHCHAGPSVMTRDLDFIAAAEEAHAAGMKAIVVKDHLAPSSVSVSLLETQRDTLLSPDNKVKVFGSICLNAQVGGLNPFALEIALNQGAKVVWLPTVSGRPFIEHRAELKQHRPPPAPGARKDPFDRVDALKQPEPIDVIDAEGKPVPEMNDIFELIRKYDAVMATGHIGPRQILAVLPAAKAAGVERIVVTHPSISYFGTTREQISQMVGGTYLEHEAPFWAPINNRGHLLPELIDLIRLAGPENTILSSDLGQLGAPHPAAGLQSVAEALVEAGIKENEIDRMMKQNQAALLGLN